jgi:small subunit ribosomal protein S21
MPRLPNVSVTTRSDENIEKMIRRFKRQCEQAGVLKRLRRKSYFEKPSVVQRNEDRKRLRNLRQSERKLRERKMKQFEKVLKSHRSMLASRRTKKK